MGKATNQIIIPNEAYVVFYNAIRERFLERLPTATRLKSENKKFGIWNLINHDDEKRRTFFECFFSSYETKGENCRHFYNRYKAALTGIKKVKEGVMPSSYEIHQQEKDLFLLDLLSKFLQIPYPVNVKQSEISNNKLKAMLLFQVFLEVNDPSVLNLYPNLKVYDRVSGKISFTAGTDVSFMPYQNEKKRENNDELSVEPQHKTQFEGQIANGKIDSTNGGANTISQHTPTDDNNPNIETLKVKVPYLGSLNALNDNATESRETKYRARIQDIIKKARGAHKSEIDDNVSEVEKQNLKDSFAKFVIHFMNQLAKREYNSIRSYWDDEAYRQFMKGRSLFQIYVSPKPFSEFDKFASSIVQNLEIVIEILENGNDEVIAKAEISYLGSNDKIIVITEKNNWISKHPISASAVSDGYKKGDIIEPGPLTQKNIFLEAKRINNSWKIYDLEEGAFRSNKKKGFL